MTRRNSSKRKLKSISCRSNALQTHYFLHVYINASMEYILRPSSTHSVNKIRNGTFGDIVTMLFFLALDSRYYNILHYLFNNLSDLCY